MRERGEEVYHLAFGQSPFSVPKCFVDELKENAHINDYLPVAGKTLFSNPIQNLKIFDIVQIHNPIRRSRHSLSLL